MLEISEFKREFGLGISLLTLALQVYKFNCEFALIILLVSRFARGECGQGGSTLWEFLQIEA
jgi:hypothetical protein